MAYLSADGKLVEDKKWSFTDYFWIPLNFIVLFFQTLLNPSMTGRGRGHASSNYISPNYTDGPPRPRRRLGRIMGDDDNDGPSPPPMVGG
ncbi:hypothetical protein Pcinc_031434 [Petrolisthes cinctipes]|uniref:Selenoprotein K n=1 Tax=Petrolisthes cinctipes TaxID=88211 RepID=A0AAE1EWP5_PETCI|nr:hypothetical protein Pcinc_031434 [Petrolisthes cinctipes]